MVWREDVEREPNVVGELLVVMAVVAGDVVG